MMFAVRERSLAGLLQQHIYDSNENTMSGVPENGIDLYTYSDAARKFIRRADRA